MCGFTWTDEPTEPADVRAAIDAFLDSGDPPIVVTSSTALSIAATSLFTATIEAAARLGRRVLLITGKVRIPDTLPAHSLSVPATPFSYVLPRAAAVVHAGGIGTTAQALRAGVPMVVVPFAFDQPDTASRVRALGVASVVDRSRITADHLAAALRQVLESPDVAARTAAVAARVSSEDGASTAADALERCVIAAARPALATRAG